ncbi:MAG: putative manganese-dependent inorganic diphosphatase [Oscillibacter sp.]|nr:putative manganese-dependent inorganic diphosphatase [Oscillibacter sp.]
MDTIYITGHRNPDTDSIVSAMAYAALKNALGDRQYLAARLGQVSDETQIVLDRFGFQPPRLITNVRTQVRDLAYDTPPTLSAAVAISRGWTTMQANKISVLPVTNEDGTLYGMLSAGDVANYDMTSVLNPEVQEIPVYNLLSVLEGKILNEGGEGKEFISGAITIALPAGRENLLFSSENSIVICGNQPDMIRRAIELRVNCVIVCQAEVDPDLLKSDTHTCIISTPIDPYQAVRLISHALPISRICKSRDLVSFRLDDYIDDVRNAVLESRFRAYPILDEEGRVVGMLSRFHLLRPRRKRVVLVDHNEKSQSVVGLDQAEILEIVDHHRLADIETKNPIYVRNEAVGSTTTIVAEMYQEKGLMPTANMAGLMAAAIVSDTVMFKSPTCTKRDMDMAHRLARIANVSLEDLGKAIFSASCGDDKTAEAMVNTDYKEFHIAGHNLAVSQITTMDSDRLLERQEEFMDVMRTIRQKRGLNTVVLMITDVLLEGTQLLFVGDEDSIRQAFSVSGDASRVFLPKIMSRKKQIIPMLSALWG